MRLLFDSAYVIDYLRDVPEAIARLRRVYEEGEVAYVNEIVVCEVRAGLRGEDATRFASMLEPVEFVQPGPDGALRAGMWRAEAHANGRHLSLADALIAAAAHSIGAAVLTRNVRDFSLTKVRIETY